MDDPRMVQYYRDKRKVVVYRTDEVFCSMHAILQL